MNKEKTQSIRGDLARVGFVGIALSALLAYGWIAGLLGNHSKAFAYESLSSEDVCTSDQDAMISEGQTNADEALFISCAGFLE